MTARRRRRRVMKKGFGLKAKVGVAFGLLGLFLLVGTGSFYRTLAGQRGDGLTINLAGAQRMLSQKMTKEALQAAQGDEEARRLLGETARRFDTVLRGLLYGDASLGLQPAKDPGVREKLETVRRRWEPFRQRVEAVARGEGDGAALEFLLKENPLLLKEADEATKALETVSRAKVDRMLRLQVILLGLNLGLMLLAWWLIGRWVVHPVLSLARLAERVREGDLSLPEWSVRWGNDEVGSLGRTFEDMVRSLRELIGRAREVARRVRAGSEEMKRASDQISVAIAGVAQAVAEEVAGKASLLSGSAQKGQKAMEEVCRSMEEMVKEVEVQGRNIGQAASLMGQIAEAIEDVARRAQKVALSSQNALSQADRGAEAVTDTVRRMAEIRDAVLAAVGKVRELGEHSERIGEIVRVIGDIADQTNLLALNAAIEAARAGEAGRGFAVVAEEVRKLAERSGKATEDIARILGTVASGVSSAVEAMGESAREVQEGASLAEEAGRALGEIIRAVEDTNQQVQGISAATEQVAATAAQAVSTVTEASASTQTRTYEVASCTGEVNGTIGEVAHVAQDLARTVEEVAASAEEVQASAESVRRSSQGLEETARDLEGVLSRFRL